MEAKTAFVGHPDLHRFIFGQSQLFKLLFQFGAVPPLQVSGELQLPEPVVVTVSTVVVSSVAPKYFTWMNLFIT